MQPLTCWRSTRSDVQSLITHITAERMPMTERPRNTYADLRHRRRHFQQQLGVKQRETRSGGAECSDAPVMNATPPRLHGVFAIDEVAAKSFVIVCGGMLLVARHLPAFTKQIEQGRHMLLRSHGSQRELEAENVPTTLHVAVNMTGRWIVVSRFGRR